MAWTAREYTKAAIDGAGEVLASDADLFADPDFPFEAWEKRQEAIEIVNNWRSCHSYPLNAFQVVLRRRARSIEKKPLLSQRIKRLAAIEFKLRERKRRAKPLPLSEMQDLGGCRAVLSSIGQVRKLVTLYKAADTVHPLDWGNNYIDGPTFTGYRSHHFIYQYHGQKKHYRRMRIEIQIRTTLQHLWATAVETAGTFQRQALKSNRGDKQWRRFFALMSTKFAEREGTAPIPGVPQGAKATEELRRMADELQVGDKLLAYNQTLRETEELAKESRLFLLELVPGAESTLKISGFPASKRVSAQEAYQTAEAAVAGRPGAEVVLVSVESLDALRRAYPSYFLDTRRFLDALGEAIK